MHSATHNRRGPATVALVGALAVVCWSVLVGCRERSEPEPPAAVSEDAGPVGDATVGDAGEAPPPKDVRIVYPPAPSEFVTLTETVGRSVVNIRTKGTVTGGPASMYPNARPDSSLGSGFLVDRRDGYVLTNLHLVESASSLHVVFANGQERDADIIGRAPHLDLALLQLGGRTLPEDIPQVKLGESDRLQVGTWVLALGNPFGGEVTASAGIISSTGGTTSVYEPPQERFRSLLHTDAAIHRGNTGGPLVNLAGEVVGVNAALEQGGGRLGFAVPMTQINRIFDQLEKGKVAETWLGVFVMRVTQTNAGACEPRGVLITQVVRGSPAAVAGLRVGDIIVRFDGHEVDGPKLTALSRSTLPGQRVELSMCRNGGALARTLVIEEKPN